MIVDLLPYDTEGTDRLPDRALTWIRIPLDGQVAIACGSGHMAFLDPAHIVADDGTITPSLGCPEEDCDWHEFGRLVEWDTTELV